MKMTLHNTKFNCSFIFFFDWNTVQSIFFKHNCHNFRNYVFPICALCDKTKSVIFVLHKIHSYASITGLVSLVLSISKTKVGGTKYFLHHFVVAERTNTNNKCLKLFHTLNLSDFVVMLSDN